MGYGTLISEELTRRPLTPAELEERREAERVIRAPEATPGGEIVERSSPTLAPRLVSPPQPATYD